MDIGKIGSALTAAQKNIDLAQAGLNELSTLISNLTGPVMAGITAAPAAAVTAKMGKASPKKRTFSPEQRALLSQRQKDRWAKVKTAKKQVAKVAKTTPAPAVSKAA